MRRAGLLWWLLALSSCGPEAAAPPPAVARPGRDLGAPDQAAAVKKSGFDAWPDPLDQGVPAAADLRDLVELPSKATSPQIPNRVAVIQYGTGDASQVDQSCVSQQRADLCAVLALFRTARTAGASMVVGPEYSQGQSAPEPIPLIGENPGTSATWPASSYTKIFSLLAEELEIYLVANIFTYSTAAPVIKYYNSLVAFGPDGAVLGVHHKFNLWGGESATLAKGPDVAVFSSPFGNVGMLICSDLTGDPVLQDKLIKTLKARVVALSSHWMSGDALEAQSDYAKKHGVYLLASNTTHPWGNGGGVYLPDGTALVQYATPSVPTVVYADIPLP